MTIDVVFCLDQHVLRPMIAAVNSVAQNVSNPKELRINVAVPMVEEEAELIRSALNAAFPSPAFELRIGSGEPPEWVKSYITGRAGGSLTEQHLYRRAMKYARLYLTEIFPDVGKFIYFDCDVIVRDDVAKLWNEAKITNEMPFAAARHLYFGPMYFRRPFANWSAGRTIRRPFNSGMFVTDARAWANGPQKRLQEILDWDAREGYNLFGLQDEPILNLTFTEYYEVSARWNRCGYGNHPFVAWLLRKPLEQMSVIHWSGGHNKPWSDRSIAYSDEWWAYDLGPVAA